MHIQNESGSGEGDCFQTPTKSCGPSISLGSIRQRRMLNTKRAVHIPVSTFGMLLMVLTWCFDWTLCLVMGWRYNAEMLPVNTAGSLRVGLRWPT